MSCSNVSSPFSIVRHLLVLFSCSAFFYASNSSAKTIKVDPAVKYQTFEGWGTSLCWWAVAAGAWEAEKRRQLVGAIVDPDTGLGYTCFRYNIGGGDNPAHSHLQAGRAVPGFKPTASGSYDWSSDKNQRAILLDIAALQKNSIFEAFSNSPPWWMTISGCASGNSNGADNLKPENFKAFAEYLATVVKYYKDEHGITFRTVEPFNEPSSGYWKSNGGQEGCGFKSRQSDMIKELGRQLKAQNLFPEVSVSAADETSLAHTVTSVKGYDDSAFSFISQINSHSYDGWGSRRAVDSLARAKKKLLWQSESGPLGKKDESDIAMWMSHVIIQDLRVMKANAWIDWQVGDQHPDWRSIELRTAEQKFLYSKRFYMHAAFSRFIRPGSTIISSSDTNSVAALVPSTGKLALVFRNDATVKTDYVIEFPTDYGIKDSADVYQFTLPGSLKKIANCAVTNGNTTLSAPAQSITTLLFNQPPTQLQKSKGEIPRKQLRGSFRDNILTIAINVGSYCKVAVYSSSGKLVCSRQGITSNAGISVDFSSKPLSAGLYFAEVQRGGGKSVGTVVFLVR